MARRRIADSSSGAAENETVTPDKSRRIILTQTPRRARPGCLVPKWVLGMVANRAGLWGWGGGVRDGRPVQRAGGIIADRGLPR